MSPDPTGMWYDPSHPGWGMSVTQQGETMFVALFVYDGSHQPLWFVASPVLDAGRAWQPSDGFSGNPGELYSGTLYQTTGMYFGDEPLPPAMKANAVGMLAMAYTADNPRALSVRYNVGTTAVLKTVQAQTWMPNLAALAGNYTGGVSIHPCACFPEMCDSPISSHTALQLTVTAGSSPSTVQIAWNPGSSTGACRYTATYVQDGQLGALKGSVACDGNSTALPLTVSNLAVSASGFSGVANLPGFCPGSIGGVRVIQ